MASSPVVVSGLGRCGSSMLMQMLGAAGFKVTGDASMPFLEDSRALGTDRTWLLGVGDDCAVKLLNPDMFPPPPGFQCRMIWMSRDYDEQAASLLKYNEQRGVRTGFAVTNDLKGYLEHRTHKALATMSKHIGERCLHLRFEDVLANPLAEARDIADFLDMDLDTMAMADQVVPRSGKCLVDMPEFKFLEQEDWGELPLVVAGLSRCGSSMMMRMLIAGGMRFTEGGQVGPPLYEDIRSVELPGNSEWLRDLGGRTVVKLLAQYKFRAPKWFRCKCIWLDRDTTEQAKSMTKYQKIKRGKVLPPISYIRKLLRERRRKSLKEVRRVATGGILMLKFEDILKDPAGTVAKVQDFVGHELNTADMVAIVEKREPECLPDLREVERAHKAGALFLTTDDV